MKLDFKDSYEALKYCIFECKEFSLGCSLNCELRKKYKIPPHGPKYPRIYFVVKHESSQNKS